MPPTTVPAAKGATAAAPTAALCVRLTPTVPEEVEASVVELPLVKVTDAPLVLTTEPDVLNLS